MITAGHKDAIAPVSRSAHLEFRQGPERAHKHKRAIRNLVRHPRARAQCTCGRSVCAGAVYVRAQCTCTEYTEGGARLCSSGGARLCNTENEIF